MNLIIKVNTTTKQSNTLFLTGDIKSIRTIAYRPDMTLNHPYGGSSTGDVLSNYLQRNIRKSGTYKMTEDFILTANGYKYIYFYWNLDKLGLNVEETSNSDGLLNKSGDSSVKY